MDMKLTVDTETLCDLLCLGIDTVQKVVCRPTFPDYIIPSGEPNGKRVWMLKDVEAWLEREKGKLPHGRRRKLKKAA